MYDNNSTTLTYSLNIVVNVKRNNVIIRIGALE